MYTLDERTIARIKDLREGNDQETFHLYLRELNEAGWSQREIAKAAGVSATSVSKWIASAPKDKRLNWALQIKPIPPTHLRTTATPKATLTDTEKTTLRALAESAGKVRRYTDPHSPHRRDAAELGELLYNHRKEGVTLSALAEACGVSNAAISQKLKKHASKG